MANKAEKSFAANVTSAIEAAAGVIKYKAGSEFENFEKAIEALKGRTKFDPSLSQYVVNTILSFDPSKGLKIGISDIGNNGATVLSVPAGVEKDGKIEFNRAMNIYLSSLAKTIRLTDAQGEPVLKGDGSQDIIDGHENTIWRALNDCKDEGEMLEWLKGKTLKVTEIKRGYGPANYVQVGDARVPKGHRLASLPLFEEC